MSISAKTPDDSGQKLAKAWDAWAESPRGKQCLDSGLLVSPSAAQYLANRLWHAFMAGAKAAETTKD